MAKRRSKQLEEAVRDYLDIKGYKYIRIDVYRCPNCHKIFNSKATGFPDFMIRNPLTFVECKTGKAVLSKEQKAIKEDMDNQNIPYILVRDNIDALMEVL